MANGSGSGGGFDLGGALGTASGAIGGYLQGKQNERRGYDRAVKQRKHGLSLFGVGDYSAIHQAVQQARGQNIGLTPDFWQKLGEETGGGSYTDIAARGGIHGIRKEYQQKFLENIQSGYQGAEQAITGSGEQAKGSVLGERKAGIADIQQSMQQAGLQSSNIAQQARANVSYQTGRALSEIDTAIGAALGELNIQKAGAMDAALQRNLGLDEQTMFELMGFLVGPSGYGPGASSQYFGTSAGQGFQSPGVDAEALGAGGAAIGDIVSSLAMLFI